MALVCVLLTGCGRRELEDRSFPTVLVAENGNIRAKEEARQAKSSKYLDYGQVKAVILSEKAAKDAGALKVILSYLESNPVFARNILIFAGDEEVCRQAEKDEEMGLYLEDLAKNQPDGGEEELALKDLLNYLHNAEPSIRMPRLCMEDGEVVPGGSIELTQEAAAAVNVPVPRSGGAGEL